MSLSRRQFVSKTALGLGASTLGFSLQETQASPVAPADRLPREVWIGSVSTMGMRAKNARDMTRQVLEVMENMLPYQPDIICLPEIFAYGHLEEPYEVKAVAEAVPGSVVKPFMEFARKNNCYVICPTYTLDQGSVYIAAVLIDRAGEVVGEYRKARPTDYEIGLGVRPGSLTPPVFETDFGTIGIQICFDIKWEDGWRHLQAAGAEIIFWPSAYAAGREVNSRAWRHQVHLVSSTQKDTTKICDPSGEIIAKTGRWQRNWVCAPVNLEMAFLLSWPAVQSFGEIQRKYGRRVHLRTFDEEEWTLIESRDPKLKVADILEEFGLQNHAEMIAHNAEVQEKYR